jgi:hypothetical protein
MCALIACLIVVVGVYASVVLLAGIKNTKYNAVQITPLARGDGYCARRVIGWPVPLVYYDVRVETAIVGGRNLVFRRSVRGAIELQVLGHAVVLPTRLASPSKVGIGFVMCFVVVFAVSLICCKHSARLAGLWPVWQ